MIRLFLTKNNGYKWFSNGGIHFKGYFWDRLGNLYNGNGALRFFEGISEIDQLIATANTINGSFCLLIIQNDTAFLLSDIIRTFPLFYRKSTVGFDVSDDAYAINEKNDTLNPLSIDEFEGTGFVFSNRTLFNEIHQTQSGQIVHLFDNSIEIVDYYTYLTHNYFHASYNELRQTAKKVILDSFARFVKSLGDRQVVICLSGGYDSRLIACMLKYYNYKNVLCITYGNKERNPEIGISQQVACELGFKWQFVEYDEELIKGYFTSPPFNAYYKYVGNFANMFMMHEYFAVKYLSGLNLIEPDAIFVTGHSGDFLGGSQITKFNLKMHMNIDNMVSSIFHTKLVFQTSKLNLENKIKDNIRIDINHVLSKYPESYGHSLIENWDMKEKLSKFIASSSTVFDFFGYEYRLPFWDKELVDFFKNIPIGLKINKLLYDALLKEEFFGIYGLNFIKEIQPGNFKIKFQIFKDFVKRYIPESIIYLLSKREDYHNYKLITMPMLSELSSVKKTTGTKVKYQNTLLIKWYLHKVTEITDL